MTYCVGMMLDRGLVLMADTRTNSGVDNISVFRKMHHWSIPGERIVALMTAGNTGPNSCSSVGPGGQTGCLLQDIRENEAAVQEAQEEATPPE